MLIKSIHTDSPYRHAIVELNYDDLCCLVNSLYHQSGTMEESDPNFDEVYKNFIELFALVKHQHIPDFELKQMYDLIDKKAKS